MPLSLEVSEDRAQGAKRAGLAPECSQQNPNGSPEEIPAPHRGLHNHEILCFRLLPHRKSPEDRPLPCSCSSPVSGTVPGTWVRMRMSGALSNPQPGLGLKKRPAHQLQGLCEEQRGKLETD